VRIRLTDRLLDLDGGVVVHDGVEHSLTPTETALLRYLAGKGEAGATRETLLREVWEYSPKVLSRTVDATVRRLRAKVEADPTHPVHLLTVYGEGYRLQAAPDPVADEGFVGRAAEAAAIASAYGSGGRLVTLLGVGGAGKTTLARRAATGKSYVWVDLGRLPPTPRDVAVALLGALSVEAGRDPIGQAGDALRGREGLFLVLDEAEGVSEVLPAMLARWLADAPHLRVLVTSRHRLGLAAERVVPVGGLSPEEARGLLVTRAREAGTPVDEGDPALTALAAALEGLPLALELAAARLGVLSPAELLARLSRRIDVLRSERADRPDRHHTLRAVIDGSWELLDERGRRTLARLALLPGGVSVPVAEALIGPDAIDVLGGLRDRSLIRDAPGDGRRWDMFEHVRAYAVEHADPESAGAVSRAVLAATEPLAGSMRGSGGPAALRRLGAERANLRAALDLAPDAETIAKVALVLDPVLAWRGPAAEQIEVLEKALAAGPPDAVAADLWRAVAYPLHSVGRLDDARRAGDRAEAMAGQDPELRARVSIWRAMHVMDTADAEAALAPAEEALRMARASGVGSVEGAALAYLAFVHVMRHDLDRAAAVAVDALASVRATGAPQVEPNVLYTLGNLRVNQGRLDEARQHYREAATKYAEWGATWREANVVLTLGNVDLVEEDWDGAREHYLHALGMYRRFGQRRGEVVALSNLGWVALEAERFDEAREWLAEGLGLSRRLADVFGEGHHLAHLGALALAEGRPGEAAGRYDDAIGVLGASRRVVWVRMRQVEAWAAQGRVERAVLGACRADLLAHGDVPGGAAGDLIAAWIDLAEGDEAGARARLAAHDRAVERSPGETREVRRNLERRLSRGDAT